MSTFFWIVDIRVQVGGEFLPSPRPAYPPTNTGILDDSSLNTAVLHFMDPLLRSDSSIIEIGIERC